MKIKFKKLIAPLLLLAVLLVMPFALANEEEMSPDIDSEDLEPLQYHYGAKMRLMQLGNSLYRNIAAGEVITENINNDDLDEIVVELKDLLEELKDLDYNSTKEELASFYREIKNDSKELSKQFRDIVHTEVDNETLELLREEIKEKHKEMVDEYKDDIKEFADQYKKDRKLHLMDIYGVSSETLKQKVREGKDNSNMFKQELKGRFKNMSKDEINDALSEIKENISRERIEFKNKIYQFKQNHTEKFQERRENFKEKFQERKEKYKDQMEEKKEELQEKREELREEKDDRKEIHEKCLEEYTEEECKSKAQEARESTLGKGNNRKPLPPRFPSMDESEEGDEE